MYKYTCLYLEKNIGLTKSFYNQLVKEIANDDDNINRERKEEFYMNVAWCFSLFSVANGFRIFLLSLSRIDFFLAFVR